MTRWLVTARRSSLATYGKGARSVGRLHKRLVARRHVVRPPLEVLLPAEQVALLDVACGVRDDEVVHEIARVHGPWDEVVDGRRFGESALAVEATAILEVGQRPRELQRQRSPTGSEQEFREAGRGARWRR